MSITNITDTPYLKRNEIMKNTILFIIISFFSFNSYSDYQCAGGREACRKGRELYRLKQITGKSCSGSHTACLEYLQDEYEDLVVERDIDTQSRMYAPYRDRNHTSKVSVEGLDIDCITETRSRISCLILDSEDNPVWFNINNPPKDVRCIKTDQFAGCFDFRATEY